MTERLGELEAGASRAAARPATTRISPVVRITGLVLGFALAIGATLAVFLTDNALYLRLAVIAVAWAFVIAAFSAGRRKTDQAVAEGRENELRQAYALELEREVAARREYELKLENQLRRETQEAMRAELDKLRADLASLAGLRDQLAGLGELRADMGRLRNELTEQLSGEMLVERIVMRTQSIRMPADRAELPAADPRLLEGTPAWGDADRPEDAPRPAPGPVHDRAPGPPPLPEPAARPVPGAADEPLPAGAGHPGSSVHRTTPPPVPAPAHRPPDAAPPAQPAPSPFDWLSAGDRGAEPSRHASPSQDDRVARPGTAARHGTAEQPRVTPPAPRTAPPQPAGQPVGALRDTPDPAGPGPAAVEPSARHHRAAPDETPRPPAEPEHEPDVYETAGHQRLTEILAESGSTAGGSRRRRRYRDDDGGTEGDDVLARVLGQN